MSKIVNWGRWVIAVYFAAWGLESLWKIILRFSNLLREYPKELTHTIVAFDAFFWIAAFACAWGILKWRLWARKLGIVLSAFWALAIGLGFGFRLQAGGKPNFFWLLLLSIGSLALIWLLLPAVRLEYSRRNQIA